MTSPHTSAPAATKPNPLVALVFGLVCPGAGLLFAGRPRAAGFVAALFVASGVLVPLVVLGAGLDLAKLPGLLRAASVAVWAPSAVFGVIAALAAPAAARKPAQHPWWVLGFIVVVWASRFALRERVVEEHIVSFAVPAEAQLRAVAPPDANLEGVYVVAKRRFSSSDVVPDAWVLVVDAQGHERVARVTGVTGTPSGYELDDGTRVSLAELRGAGVLAR